MDRCRAEVDLSRLKKNFETIKEKCDDVFAVVKANAYGHGATEVAKTLEESGCKKFAVASVYEAESLRKNGINGEIAILGLCEDFGLAREIAARPLVYDEHTLCLAKKYDAEVFVKINTGMNRLGFSTIGETASAVKNLRVLGVFTHLSSADGDDATDRRITEAQIKNFMEAELVVKNEKDVPFYAENSAALIKYGRFFDGARIGIALYGVNPVPGDKTPLLPVMTFRAAVIAINTVKKGDFIGYSRGYRAKKDMRVAIISTGYADGLPRALSNKGMIFCNGQFLKIVGKVSMDSVAVDAGDLDVKIMDEVVVFGDEITVTDVANRADTLPYEILTGVSERVKRVYKNP